MSLSRQRLRAGPGEPPPAPGSRTPGRPAPDPPPAGSSGPEPPQAGSSAPDPAPAGEPLDDRVTHAVGGLFRRDSLYMLVWALQLVSAAALTPVITRVMGSAQFGQVAAAIAVMQVLFAVTGLGLQTAIQRHFAQDGPDAARRLLTVSLILATAATVLADVTGPLWSLALGFDGYGAALRLAVYWAGSCAVTYSALGLLRSQDRLLMFGCVGLLQSVVAEAMSLLLVLAGRPTAAMFLLGRLVAQVLAVAVALVATSPKGLRSGDRTLVLAGLGYALPLVPSELSTFVLNTADRLIVQDELGLTAVARYQIAYNIGAIPMILVTILNVAWMPRIFALDAGTERSAVLAASRDALYRLLTPVVIGLSVGAPVMLRLWAPPEYRPDDLLLVTALVVVSVVPYAAGLSLTRGLLAHGETATVAVATAVAAGVNVVLNLLLVPRYELVGSAAGTFLAYACLHGLLLLRSRIVVPIRGPGPARLLAVTAAVVLSLLTAALPTGTGFLVLRAALVLVTLAWFGFVLARVGRRRRRDG